MSCCMNYHQDIFSDPNGENHPYDHVALFILNGRDITPHALEIGEAINYPGKSDSYGDENTDHDVDIDVGGTDNSSETEIIEIMDSGASNDLSNDMPNDVPNDVPNDTPNDMSNDKSNKYNVREICSIKLGEDGKHFSDVGYIINQRRNLYHKHSKFVHKSHESRRNVLAIRFVYK